MARKAKGEEARIARSIRLLRKGAISRAGKALESKGLGDLQDPQILQQLRDKFPVRVQVIPPEVYAYAPERELELKAEQILSKLDWNAAPGPSGLRNGHLRMWVGAFAPPAAEQ